MSSSNRSTPYAQDLAALRRRARRIETPLEVHQFWRTAGTLHARVFAETVDPGLLTYPIAAELLRTCPRALAENPRLSQDHLVAWLDKALEQAGKDQPDRGVTEAVVAFARFHAQGPDVAESMVVRLRSALEDWRPAETRTGGSEGHWTVMVTGLLSLPEHLTPDDLRMIWHSGSLRLGLIRDLVQHPLLPADLAREIVDRYVPGGDSVVTSGLLAAPIVQRDSEVQAALAPATPSLLVAFHQSLGDDTIEATFRRFASEQPERLMHACDTAGEAFLARLSPRWLEPLFSAESADARLIAQTLLGRLRSQEPERRPPSGRAR